MASSAAPATLQLSYMEIYNEQVRDLLKQRPKNAILRYKSRFDKKDVDSDEYRTLKVRHHPSKGIYVDGLTSVPAGNWAECEAYLQQGNALRTQCSTAMNAKSSRSHAIFQLQMTQRERTGGRVRGRDVALESFSKVNLVDLAGSERNAQSKTTGKHLAEANSINASLSTLRRVLDGLIANRNAAQSGVAGAGKSKKGAVVIPYRESLLTYVLSDNLGGNSFTVMCANVSPCAANAGETESTLRYATLAKSVVNHAKLNEAPTARVIREMRDQLRVMQEALRSAPDPSHVAELEEGVQLSEELLRTMRSREGDYEAQLQAQAAQADALRHAVEAHKQQESFWREEAQRQQREVEDLREALLEATQHSTRGGRGGASAPLHLPSLGVMQSPFTSDLGADGEGDDAGAAKAAKAPSGKKKRASTTTTTGATPPSGKMEEVLLSPASRDWKPARARGTPLSLMGGGGRSKQRPSRPSLPTLPEGPSSAPEKSRRASRTSVGAPTTAPPSGQPRSTTTSKQQQQQSPPLAPRPPPSTKAPHVAGRRGDGEKEGSLEPPSFYQTEEYLVPHTDEAPSSSRLDFSHLDPDVSALMAGYAEGPAVPSRESGPPDLHSALDVQQLLLQAQAEDAALRHGGGAWDGGLEIEGVAATPSKQAPAHSTRVAVARKAQAERDRRRSSCTAATATTATKKKLKKKKVVKANPAGDGESRGTSVARDGAWTPEANSMSVEYAQAAEVIEVSERGGDGRPSLKSGEDHDDDDDGVEYLTSGASRSQHGDDGLTNMHSANADYRDGEDDRAHGHALATVGDLHQATAAAAAASMHAHRSNASEASGDEGDRLWGLNDEVGDEELYADDMESAAASLNRSAKAANVAPPLTKKKKSKSNGGRRANADSTVGSRHYSTVDTLH